MKKIIYLFLLLLPFSVSAMTYDLVVAKDGSGNFTSIQAAINSIRDFRPEGRTIIFIKKGVYAEKVILPTQKTEITLIGEDRDSTILTWNDHANINKMGTFKTFTFLIQGNDIVLENLTIENNAPRLGQAVALHVEGDRVAFYNCRFLGNQDTIYLGREGCRNYFNNCYIEGTTDFIFGSSTAWFEHCIILGKVNSFLTAASTPPNIPYGFVFNKCTILTADSVNAVYLGRPWRTYAYTLFKECALEGKIKREGWHNWGKVENEANARYAEYKNTGPGADLTGRVTWAKQLSKKEAAKVNLKSVFGNWLPAAN
ncbi:MAG TPA: pectinesterase family protein [Bacteroidales bacterium]|nr:pectinesterase family protein [Bacteroidales bacterium]